MPVIPLHTCPLVQPPPVFNPLPTLLHTPSGLALLEVQGDIRFPPSPNQPTTQIGRLIFPLYNPEVNGDNDTKWMKRAYFYVGKNQRMAGELKKLVMPFAVVRKRECEGGDATMGDQEGVSREELEIVDVVKYKVVFSTRPEPIGTAIEENT